MRPADGHGRRFRVALAAALVAVAGSGLLLDAGSAHAAVGRATDRCDEYIALSDDLTTLDTSQKFDADGYARIADDFADAAKDAPSGLRQSMETAAALYAKVGRSKNKKAAIKLYLKGLQKYGDDLQALDDYIQEHCRATSTTKG